VIEIKPYIEHAVLVGLMPVKRFTQRLDQPNTSTYVGEGKLEEIRQFIVSREEEPSEEKPVVDVVIFDDELSPRQIRNLEKAINHREKHPANVRVIDRTILILEIFLQRAQTSYAKTQVEMAHLQYMLPRLTRMWSHLDRQRGGGGTNRGMGETQIEADKRVIGQRIALLREQLKTIDKQMATQRQHRGKMVRVALVGYTNVGKSTLMNLLSKSDVFAENKLFATLDTTVRKVTIENLPFLLSDTVGFIRKLPHHLVESFKSTLDEVREADLLIHVVDISHPNFEEQYEVVEQTLNSPIRRKKKMTSRPSNVRTSRSLTSKRHGWRGSERTASSFRQKTKIILTHCARSCTTASRRSMSSAIRITTSSSKTTRSKSSNFQIFKSSNFQIFKFSNSQYICEASTNKVIILRNGSLRSR